MKSLIDLSSFTNKSRLSNRGKIIKQSSNNKSYFSSNPTIENHSRGKNLKIGKNYKYLKQSNTNNENKSKNKSNDSKKIKSNDKNNNIEKNKFIGQSYRTLRHPYFPI